MSIRTLTLTSLILLTFLPPAQADDLLRFSVPATTAGIRGTAGVTFHGYAGPKNRLGYYTQSVFREPDLANNVIMIATTADSTADANGNEIPSSDTHELLVGRSTDNGQTFYFRRALDFSGGLRLAFVAMAPDPVRYRVWVGTAQVYANVPNSVTETLHGTTRIEIDWNTQKIRLLDQDGIGWDEYPLGFRNPPEPGYFDETGLLLTSIVQVTVNNQTRLEAWGVDTVARGGQAPCSGPSYNSNINYYASQLGAQKGQQIVWYRFDPTNGVDLSSKKSITSSVRTLPSDYPFSDGLPVRGELGNEEFLLVSTRDQAVCNENLTLFTGASIKFIKLQYNAVTDNYNEVEQANLLNIANPTSPNWTCPANTQCSWSTRSSYGFIGAVPLVAGSLVQLYTMQWASVFPTQPSIGEIGTVSVSQTPKVVTLSRSYTEPVVFVQPPSYAGATPVIARVSDVLSNRFTVRLQTDSGPNGVHPTETLSYMVFERGTYRVDDRRVLEVDKVTVNQTYPSTVSWQSDLDLRDSMENDTGTVVFSQLQTMNDPYFAVTRMTAPPTVSDLYHCNPIGQCGNIRVADVNIGIEEDEAALHNGRQHGLETAGVLLLSERWLGRRSGVYTMGPIGAKGFDVRRLSVNGLTSSWTPVTFEQPVLGGLANPILLAWLETHIGGNPANLRYRNLTSNGVELGVDEDTSFDAERNHIPEGAVYLVIGKNNGVVRGQRVTVDKDHIF